MESIKSLPMPGHAKMVSVTIAKAMRLPNSTPTTVTIGIMMFFRTCTRHDSALGQALGAGELHEIEQHRFAHAAAREAYHQARS